MEHPGNGRRYQEDDEEEEEEEGQETFVDEGDVLQEYTFDGDDDQEPPEDLDDGQDDAVQPSTTEPVYCVATNPKLPDVISTGGNDDRAYLWRIGHTHSGGHRALAGHTDSVAAVAFSSDGTYVATGGLEGMVQVFRSEDGEGVKQLEGPAGGIEWLQWHPRGNVLLAGSEDFSAWMWNVPDGQCMQVFAGHAGSVTCGGFTPDGRAVCTGSQDASMKLWDPRSGACTHTIKGKGLLMLRHMFHSEALTSMDIALDNSIAATGSEDGTACLTNVVGMFMAHTDSVETVGLCKSLPMLASGSLDGRVILWDLTSMEERGTCAHQYGVVKVLWHPTSPLLITGCLDGAVRVWDARTGACERTLSGHRDHILDIAFVGDASMVVSTSDDGTARVFRIVG
eukprot:jgi/Chlat1/8118/Chrsp75S07571